MRLVKLVFVTWFYFSWVSTPSVLAGEWTIESSETEVGLVELFSSEGCSSCPPAEAWLSGLRGDSGLWKRFVPVEFHVDYWNRLGWQDPYSRESFTARQHGYANEWGVRQVYTPAVVLKGQEWKLSRNSIPKGEGARVGILKVKKTDNVYSIEFFPAGSADGWTVNAALLGNGMVSRVTSGENQGRTLQHEFVVLNLNSRALVKRNGRFVGDVSLFSPPDARPASKSLAVWVSRAGEQRPVQAVGGDLP